MITIQDPNARPKPQDIVDSSQQLESLFIKQLLEASGAFKGTPGVAGADLHAQLFTEVLADAVAKSGGIGLAKQIAESVAPRAQHDAAPISGAGAHEVKDKPADAARALKAYQRRVDCTDKP